jgi:hypothetical protein
MAGFFFRLEHEDGTSADPPTLHTAVPNWRPGDTIPLGRRTLRVIEMRTEKDSGRARRGICLGPGQAERL